MQITISRDAFIRALTPAVAASPSRASIPVLSAVRLTVTGNTLRCAGTDLDVFVETSEPLDPSEADDGATCVPAKKLLDLVKLLPPSTVRIDIRNKRLRIRCGRSTTNLEMYSADEWSFDPQLRNAVDGEVPLDTFLTAIRRVAYAASEEANRPILQGVLVRGSDTGFVAVATNGHQLAEVQAAWDAPRGATPIAAGAILARRMVQTILAAFKPSGETVALRGTSTHLQLSTETLTVAGRLIEGPYPDYERLLTAEHAFEARCDINALRAAIRRTAIVTGGKNATCVRMTFDSDTLTLNTQQPDIGAAQDSMVIQYGRDPFEVGFRPMYLLQTLDAMPGDEVILRSSGPERAMFFQPVDAAAHRYLIMPMRLMEQPPPNPFDA